MTKGEIYQLDSKFRDCYNIISYNHPFIYWKEKHSDIMGIMLTKSENPIHNNIYLSEDHFEKGHTIKFGDGIADKKSLIAPLYLMKEIKDEHIIKCGNLTKKGIEFLAEKVPQLKYTDWVTHYNKMKKTDNKR